MSVPIFQSSVPSVSQYGACLTFDSGQFPGLGPGGGGSIKGVGADAATIAFRGMWNVGNSVREGDTQHSQMMEADLET